MSETVHVEVIKGSISTWEDGGFKKGDVFETTREKALQIDPSFIQILEDLPPVKEVLPESLESPEAAEATVTKFENEGEKSILDVAEVGEVQEATPKKKRKKATEDAS